MERIGNIIFEARKQKGLSQEELAEKSKVNLRTIQRLENNKNEPRGTTLEMICTVLQINPDDFTKGLKHAKQEEKLINKLVLIISNLILSSLFYYLTLHEDANINSRLSCFLLSFFISYFIINKSVGMEKNERVLKFGFGLILLISLVIISKGLTLSFLSGLFPCVIIFLYLLYNGKKIINRKQI